MFGLCTGLGVISLFLLGLGFAFHSDSDMKKGKGERNGLIMVLVGAVVIVFVATFMSLGSISLQDKSPASMQFIVSGQYRIDKDCYGNPTSYIGDKEVKDIGDWFFTSQYFTGDGKAYYDTPLGSQYPTPQLIVGNTYSVYMKQAFLQNNIVILCGTY